MTITVVSPYTGRVLARPTLVDGSVALNVHEPRLSGILCRLLCADFAEPIGAMRHYARARQGTPRAMALAAAYLALNQGLDVHVDWFASGEESPHV